MNVHECYSCGRLALFLPYEHLNTRSRRVIGLEWRWISMNPVSVLAFTPEATGGP